MKKLFLTAIALFACMQLSFGQVNDPVVQKILDECINNNQVMVWENDLVNRIGGRITGSAAYEDACKWAEQQFTKWGLKTYREEVGEVPVGFSRGPWFGRMIGGSGATLHFATPSYTSGTVGVQRGHVVKEPTTRAEFEKIKGTLKGAWVLINGTNDGWPIDHSENGDKLRAADLAYNDSIAVVNRNIQRTNREIQSQKDALAAQIASETNKSKKAKLQAQFDALKLQDLIPTRNTPALFYKEMKAAGILGIIQSAPVPIKCMYDRKNHNNFTWETLPDLPDIKLDQDQYNEIKHIVDRGERIDLEFDIRNHFRPGPIKYHNVFAVIPGTEYPDEYVIVGGHLDSYDSATGGVDCAVGTTVAMEVGRVLAAAGAKPKRTIILALWAAEECGLVGSKSFVTNHMDMMPKISNYINRDGGPTVPTGATVIPAMYDDFVAISAPLKGVVPFEVRKRVGEPGPRPTTASGSDHAYFAINGVPTISFDQGEPTGSNFNYSDIWHTDRDLYNKMIPENQENTVTITAIIAYGLANLDHILDRTGLYRN